MKMNATASKTRCAARLSDNEADQRALEGYLQENGLTDAVRFLPREDDDLDAQVCAGHFDRVVFPNLESLLTAIWESEPQIDRWAKAGVRVELANPGSTCTVDWLALVQTMHQSLKRWHRQRRHRQIIASILLSLVALAAVVALLLLIPPAG